MGCDNIFYSSFTVIISIIGAIYYKLYIHLIYCVFLFLTAINHWYCPQYGFRRDLDMVVCANVVLFHIYSGVICNYYTYIIGIIIIGFVYHQSKKEYENKNYSIACKYHMLTHFLANFFNILLYMNIYK